MKVAWIVLLALLNLGIFIFFQSAQSSLNQAMPEINPEKMKILNEQEVEALSNAAVEAPVETPSQP